MEFKLLFLVFCAFLFLDVAISSREFDEGEDDLNQQQQQTEDDEGLIQFQRNLNPGPSILARSQIPEVVDACLEPKRTGRCKAHVPRYWFNSVSGQCERFTFGGCGGNGNNFEDITACEQRCSGHLKKALKPEQIDGDDDEICAQPPYDTSKSNSSCRAYLPRWFYNATTETCETFIYKGCGATQNLYRNKNLCQAKCGHYRLPKAIDSNPESQDLTARVRSKACELPMNPGPCFAINNRFYYNKENGRCQAFVYGGCGGNGNNFQTDEECSRSCGGATPSYNTGCAKISCPWHMYTHYTSMDCKPIYDGQACCPTRFDCPSDMNQTTTTSTLKAQPTCKYNGKVYQIGEKIPEASSNSACRAACNCYESEGKARINCVSIECPEDFGAVPAGKENCTRLYEKDVCCATGYHCPSEQQPAPAFTCQYEGNTYVEGERIKLPRGQCQNCLCQRGFNGTLTSQFCEPIDCGIEIYYSEQLSRGCSPVYFRSTDGSEGCCPIGWECPDEQDLSPTQSPISSKSLIQQPAPAPGTDRAVTVAVCSLKADSGPCRASRPRFFFNSTSNRCERFIYGGCEGNGNNFAVLKDCETVCAATSRNTDNSNDRSPLVRAGSIPSLPSKTYELTELDACTQPPKKGVCRGYFPRYYFSPNENQCKFFVYGGCRGNKNNFHSLEACAAVCQNIVSPPQNNLIRLSNNPNDDEIDNSGDSSRVNFDDQKPLPDLSHSEVVDITNESRGTGVYTVEIDEEDPCTPKPETGRCKGHIRRYYYDSEAQYCKQFVYGGCGGNRNNFERLKECDIRCSPNKGQGLPGPGNVRAQIRWRSMAVGGPKPEESNRTQAVFGGYLERCNLPLQVGSCKATMKAYYYDVEAQECMNFTYSGCFGNANRFPSLAECQATCTSNKQTEGTTTTSSPVSSRSGNLPRVRVQDIPSGRRERPEKHVVEEVQEDKEYCSLPATSGNCRGHNLRYYFNSELSQCLPFVYSGCRGNQNNFLTESDCISACSKEPTIEALTQEGVLTCSFGNETIPIGGKLGGNPGEEPCGVPICQCLTPPSLTCIQVQCPPPPPPQAYPPPCPTPNCGPLCKPSIRPDNGCPTCDCEGGSEFQSVEFVTPNVKCQGAGCPSLVKNVKG